MSFFTLFLSYLWKSAASVFIRVLFGDRYFPSAAFSSVTLTIKRRSASDENVGLRIDDAGESWVGQSQPVADPATTIARLAFSIRHEPYWIDLPFVRH